MDQRTLEAWQAGPFAAVLRKADAAEEAQRRAPDRGWWRDPSIWSGAGDAFDNTASEAFSNILLACKGSRHYIMREARADLAASWRGVDWEYMKRKALESPATAEAFDRQYMKEVVVHVKQGPLTPKIDMLPA